MGAVVVAGIEDPFAAVVAALAVVVAAVVAVAAVVEIELHFESHLRKI